jgi:hypothetical protein
MLSLLAMKVNGKPLAQTGCLLAIGCRASPDRRQAALQAICPV